MPGISQRSGAGEAAFVWGGALAFAASLAWFVFSYLIRFDRPADPGPRLVPIAADVALFSLFALHHSLFARTALKTRVQSLVAPHLERSFYTWAASLLFIATTSWWLPVPGVLYRLDGIWAWAGGALQAGGFVLTVFGATAVDALDLAGVRAFVQHRRGEAPKHVPLTTSGVFGLVRHPLYFGWALFVLGAPHMTATRAVFALVSTAYVALALQWEERSLIATFGDAYREYRKKVRWRMLPGLY